METSSPWKDIGNKFCICSICLDQLKEPKLLPCLHRYCKDCLNSIIQGRYDFISCPQCREQIQIPTNGVDGFKTDFYSKSLVEYVQIQQSLKSDEIRECYGCSKHLRVAAYCFKCNDFLCKDCHNFHVISKIVKDHQKHILSLEDIDEKNITMEKLASMRDAPRCGTHPEKLSELYCETCINLPICMACMLGEHKGHNLHEVKALAKLKREELSQKLKALEEMKKSNDLITPIQAKETLILNVSIEKEKVTKMHEETDQKIMTEVQDIENRRQQVKKEKENSEKTIFDSLQKEMDNEIQEVKKKYERIFKAKKVELTNTLQARESSLEEDLTEVWEKRKHLDKDKKKLLESIEEQLNENVEIIDTISKHFDNMQNRFETLNVMTSSILVSDNDWSAVQCIPDMCTAATNIMKDLKKDFLELTSLTHVTVDYKQCSFRKTGITKISDQVQRKIAIKNPYRCVLGVTNNGDGDIVLSGIIPGAGTFIIVIDMNGRILEEKKLKARNYWLDRYCKFLSQHKVASVCEPNEIGLFDMRYCSYYKKNISDVISSWSKDRDVPCVATDPVNNHILVSGYNSRDVYVFDIRLRYLYILTLPEMITWPRDITVSDSRLLVCDYDEKKSFLTTMDGLESKLVGEFMKPNLEGKDFGPYSVCTDKNGLVYMLWKDDWCPGERYLVQYNHNGSQVLATKKLDGNANAVTVVETSQEEKVVVATDSSQTVYVYDLITVD